MSDQAGARARRGPVERVVHRLRRRDLLHGVGYAPSAASMQRERTVTASGPAKGHRAGDEWCVRWPTVARAGHFPPVNRQGELSNVAGYDCALLQVVHCRFGIGWHGSSRQAPREIRTSKGGKGWWVRERGTEKRWKSEGGDAHGRGWGLRQRPTETVIDTEAQAEAEPHGFHGGQVLPRSTADEHLCDGVPRPHLTRTDSGRRRRHGVRFVRQRHVALRFSSAHCHVPFFS